MGQRAQAASGRLTAGAHYPPAMGLFDKIVGDARAKALSAGRAGETAVNETLGDDVRVLPGVTGHTLVYRHTPGAAQPGEITGEVEVADLATMVETLRAVRRTLGGLLGDGADDVLFAFTGRIPDGAPVHLDKLRLVQPLTGREVQRRLLS